MLQKQWRISQLMSTWPSRNRTIYPRLSVMPVDSMDTTSATVGQTHGQEGATSDGALLATEDAPKDPRPQNEDVNDEGRQKVTHPITGDHQVDNRDQTPTIKRGRQAEKIGKGNPLSIQGILSDFKSLFVQGVTVQRTKPLQWTIQFTQSITRIITIKHKKKQKKTKKKAKTKKKKI